MADEMNWGALYDSAGEADKPLPNGSYNVEVTKAEAKTTKNGKPMFSLSAKVLDGPHAGRFVWHNLTVTVENPNAMRMFFLNMAAFGLGDAFFKRSPAPNNTDVANALVGRRAQFDVGTQTSGAYAGRNEVKSVKAATIPGASGPSVPGGAGPSAPAPAVPATPAVPQPAVAPVVPAPAAQAQQPGF